jgi:ArsR family transcriptional regulator
MSVTGRSTEEVYVSPEAVERAIADMPPDDALGRLAETFGALGEPTRLRILYALSRAELCVCDLSAALGISESNCSHQLKYLKLLRLVRSRREGKHVFYALDDAHIHGLFLGGLEHVLELSGIPRGVNDPGEGRLHR